MKSKALKLDLFRKLPKDLTEPTFCGAIVSMLCTIVLIVLTISELKTYLAHDTKSDLISSEAHTSDKFKINLNIEFPFMPCDIIALNVEDTLGTRIIDYYGELHKERLSSDGKVLSIESWAEKNSMRKELLSRVREELDANQGCRLRGFIEVNRIPGNFHINHSIFGDIMFNLEN